MSREWRVVVENGDDNLYRITEYDDTYHVYQVHVSLINDNEHIGKTDSLKEAMLLVMVHSGDDIEEIIEV